MLKAEQNERTDEKQIGYYFTKNEINEKLKRKGL